MNKSKQEKIQNIVSAGLEGKHKVGKITIQIHSVSAIEGGIELFVSAWNKNKQIGFGTDGTVEIERFLIYNPPVLVDDENGDIFLEKRVGFNEIKVIERYREDAKESTLRSLILIIGRVGIEGERIVRGKIGNTTSTFYPAAGDTSPTDNSTRRDRSEATFADIVDDTTADSVRSSSTDIALVRANTTTDRYQRIDRAIFGFDTSAIPDTDVITSATISLYVTTKSTYTDTGLGDTDIDIIASSPDSTSTIATGDYDSYPSSTVFASKAISAWTDGGYSDFTLNANGVAHISKTTYTFFGAKVDWDNNASFTGTWASNALTYASWDSADTTGTSKDPMLVVVHAAPTNIKSYNTNVKANVKTINTNPIANVKSLNTNA